MNVLPWHTDALASLLQRHREGRLPHALLLAGPPGIGRRRFAEALAAALLCLDPAADGTACGACSACQLRAAGTHPDRLHLAPEDSSVIRIDQIRELIGKLALSRHHAAWRVVILEPAEALNIAAANALLKTLEEPPPQTLMILLATRLAHLPATIRSRCQLLRMPLPSADAATAWLRTQGVESPEQLLQLAGGAPLIARQLDAECLERHARLFEEWVALAEGRADPVKLAGEWIKPDAEWPIQWMQLWIGDMIRQRQGGRARLTATAATLQTLAGAIDLQRLHRLLERVNESRRLLASQVNAQTLLEGLLIHWHNLPRQKTA